MLMQRESMRRLSAPWHTRMQGALNPGLRAVREKLIEAKRG
jgi:hypothetical protein